MTIGERDPAKPAGAAVRVARLLRAEAARLRGRPGPAAALLAVSAASLLASVGVAAVMPWEDRSQLVNGWRALAMGASWGLTAGSFLAALLSSQSVAAEAASGSLRTTLTRQALRLDVFAAKTLWALASAAAFHAAAWGPALLAGAALGFGDVTERIAYADETYVHVHRRGAEMASQAGLAFLLSFAPLAAASLLGLACSCVARKPASALAAAVVAFLALWVGSSAMPPGTARLSFTAWTTRFPSALADLSSGLNVAPPPASDAWTSIAVSAASSIILLSGSFIYFSRRDLTE